MHKIERLSISFCIKIKLIDWCYQYTVSLQVGLSYPYRKKASKIAVFTAMSNRIDVFLHCYVLCLI